jgi:hypothetical protein
VFAMKKIALVESTFEKVGPLERIKIHVNLKSEF